MHGFKVIAKLGDVTYQAKPKIGVEAKKRIKNMEKGKPNSKV